MKTHNVAGPSVNIPIPMQNVISAAIAGVEGGISYWARVSGYRPTDRPEGGYDLPPFEAIDLLGSPSQGHAANARYRITPASLVRGLRIMAEKYPRHAARILEDSSDAETGDVLIQCATLGEIVYG